MRLLVLLVLLLLPLAIAACDHGATSCTAVSLPASAHDPQPRLTLEEAGSLLGGHVIVLSIPATSTAMGFRVETQDAAGTAQSLPVNFPRKIDRILVGIGVGGERGRIPITWRVCAGLDASILHSVLQLPSGETAFRMAIADHGQDGAYTVCEVRGADGDADHGQPIARATLRLQPH